MRAKGYDGNTTVYMNVTGNTENLKVLYRQDFFLTIKETLHKSPTIARLRWKDIKHLILKC